MEVELEDKQVEPVIPVVVEDKEEGIETLPPIVPTEPTVVSPTATKKKNLWEVIPAWGYAVLVLAVVVMAVAIGIFAVGH